MTRPPRHRRDMIAPTLTSAQPAFETTVRSPAKINFALQVLGRRTDGFHEVRSLAVGVDLHDTIHVATTDGAISLTCNDPSLPVDGKNLILRAARGLREAASIHRGARIHLEKRIPTGAGLGGGSGNAAAILRALNESWDARLSDTDLINIGAGIGSDVPLFFSLPAVRMTGRGERYESVEMAWSGWALLAFAGCEVSTASVYSVCQPKADATDCIAAMLEAQNADELAALCVNDLETAVFKTAPDVERLYNIVSRIAPRAPRITGAGQTVYVLCDQRDEADALRAALAARDSGIRTDVVRIPIGP